MSQWRRVDLRYRLVATDIDGTLLNDSLEVSARTRSVLERLRRHGVDLVLSTARPPRAIGALYAELNLSTPVIAYNGALVYDPLHERPLFHHPIPRALAQQVVSAIRAEAPDLNIGLELADEWHVDFMDEPTRRWMAVGAGKPPIVGDVDEAIASSDRGVSKFYLIVDEPLRQRISAVLRRTGLIDQVAVTASGADMFEIMAAGVDKGAALRALATLRGVPRHQTLALGDGLNDIALLQEAGLGIAMGNAPAVVKQAARAVTGSNAEDGWAEAIEKYVIAG